MPEKLDFLTPTTIRTLEFFCLHPMQEFHEREIMRRVQLSKGSSNKILRTLARFNFLIREKRGRMVFYKLNMKNPVIRQFKTLLNVFRLRELIDELSECSKKIILFGSCATGTDVEDSDIDLYILTSQKNLAKEKIIEYNKKNERKIESIVVDINDKIRLKKEDVPLYERIERGIALWGME